MLVLSRRVGESIRVEGPCVITVLRIELKKCRIGIQADDSVAIHREEVYERVGAKSFAKQKVESGE